MISLLRRHPNRPSRLVSHHQTERRALFALALALLVALLAACASPAGAEVPVALRPVEVATGETGTCAVLATGSVVCWGDNTGGELGDGLSSGPDACGFGAGNPDGDPPAESSCSWTPVLVKGIDSARQVAVGKYSACAVLEDGTVDCWGANGYGNLGDGSSVGPEKCRYVFLNAPSCSTDPVRVRGLIGVTQVALGAGSDCAVLNAGTVSCWGDDELAALGSPPDEHSGCAAGTSCAVTPTPVNGVDSARMVAVGEAFACALMSAGSVSCWGDNQEGELGDGNDSPGPAYCGAPIKIDFQLAVPACDASPVQVTGITDAIQIVAADQSACALLATGRVDCWGYDGDGELGDGNIARHDDCFFAVGFPCDSSPVQVSGMTDAVQVAAVGEAVCAVTSARSEMCWGDWADGLLDESNPDMPDFCASAYPCSWSPTKISAPAGIVQATPSCALARDAQLYCWQDDSQGELGNGPHFVQVTLTPHEHYTCFPDNFIPVQCSPKPVLVLLSAAYGCDIPNLADTSLPEAKQWLLGAGCRLGSVRAGSSALGYPRGVVISSEPVAGIERKSGFKVNVVVES